MIQKPLRVLCRLSISNVTRYECGGILISCSSRTRLVDLSKFDLTFFIWVVVTYLCTLMLCKLDNFCKRRLVSILSDVYGVLVGNILFGSLCCVVPQVYQILLLVIILFSRHNSRYSLNCVAIPCVG